MAAIVPGADPDIEINGLEPTGRERLTFAMGLSSRDRATAAAALMGLDDGIAVLDLNSDLVLSNLAWEEFVHAQSGLLVPVDGERFLDHWERSGLQDQALGALASGLQSVLDGTRALYSRDVEVTDAGAQRWLQVKITPIPDGCTVTLTDITQRKLVEQRLSHDAMHDHLTGLANRALFTDRLSHALRRRPDRFPVSVALLLIDIDHFKSINDSYGHQDADGVLETVANRIKAGSRPGDTVARLGGDEFAMICDNISDSRLAMRIAQRLLVTVNQPIHMANGELDLSLSIGLAMSDPDSNADARELIQQADTALYRAKLAGRSRVELFDDVLRQEVTERLTLERDLRMAFERKQFRLQYQPMVNLLTSKVSGAEALLRWDHPTKGVVMPDAFIRIVEESNLVLAIGQWVLETACEQAVSWDDPEVTISVNVSGRQLQDPEFVTIVVDILERTGLTPDRLCLEITESVLIEDGEKAAQRLSQLRRLGVHVALDDFGTGFSSLSYLHRFPVDIVKIDRSFVEGLGTDEDSRVIVSAIMSMTSALGVDVVAEGVETLAQMEQLIAIGSRTAQGFYFSRPLDQAAMAMKVSAA
jgi:diguanylate cyclase (GGDEF)-like protein